MDKQSLLMPAEWHQHAATWIAWPFLEEDFPERLATVESCYVEIVRNLQKSEPVHCICCSETVLRRAQTMLEQHHVSFENVLFHICEINRTWLRDSAPTAVHRSDGSLVWIRWLFNAWAKYDNYQLDRNVPPLLAEVSGHDCIEAQRADIAKDFVLEGGAIETDGQGTLLVTEECLLSNVQERNPGLSRAGYEELFKKYLGIKKTIWLGAGCLGDDTHGHIDDIARFVAPGRVVVAVPDAGDVQYSTLFENQRRLEQARDANGNSLEVVTLPMPGDIWYQGEQLPASYANFYIANTRVLVPTFNDPMDRVALGILQKEFPDREVIGIHCRELLIGQGTLHCLTQQQPNSVSSQTTK